MAKRWRIAPDLQKLSNVGLTLGQRRHPDRENTNHYTTLAQQQHAERDHTNHYTTLAQRDIASWDVDMWDSFVGNEELYFRDGLHLSGKGAAVLAEGLSGAVASGLGKVRYLNQLGRGDVEKDYRWTKG